jgi:uncharacterized lipoprotein YddW (UPF0748 family)
MNLTKCFASVLAVLFFCFTTEAQVPPKREFRAAWVATVTNLDWPTTPGADPQVQKNQLITMLDQLKANGISAVVFQVRPECDALYQSSLEPWSYWLTGQQGRAPNPFYDPLEFAVAEAHKRGMELHAWFNPYRAERSVGNYTLASNHVVVQHPDWVIQIGTLKFLDPGLPLVREFDARVITDVVRRYDVDGIHMDDYFYPYPPNQITNQDAGTFSSYPRGFTNVADWRRDNVNLLIQMIHDSVQAVKPHVKIGMSPFGIWKSGTPSGIVGMSSYSEIYCDPIAWLQKQTIDYLTPQLYWAIGGGQDYSRLMPWWADSTAAYGRHFYPGKAAYRISSWSASEMPNQLRLDRANPKVGGTVFFRANNGINDNLRGFADSLKGNLYQYPALHPVMAWKDTIAPYPPRGIRYATLYPGGPFAIQWDLPIARANDDTACRYAIYRFDHSPSAAELADPRNLASIEGRRYVIPQLASSGGKPIYYTVTALDRNYNESDTSRVLRIAPPSAPSLLLPLSGNTAVPDTVKVVWSSADLAASYHLQVSTDPSFGQGLVVNDSSLVDTVKSVGGLLGLTAYHWRVRAANAAGFGSYSASSNFTTGFPASPNLLYPPNIFADAPVNLRFLWGRAPAASTYRFQLSTAADFAATMVDSAGLADTSLAGPGLDNYKVYFWRVKAINALGSSGWSSVFRFRTVQVSSVEAQGGLPTAYALSQNFPNPFNPTTTIQFALPQSGRVSLKVYDVLGREEATLVNDEMPAGNFSVRWNASQSSSGVYFFRITAGSFSETKRMVLVR